jgi:hypothetical protein
MYFIRRMYFIHATDGRTMYFIRQQQKQGQRIDPTDELYPPRQPQAAEGHLTERLTCLSLPISIPLISVKVKVMTMEGKGNGPVDKVRADVLYPGDRWSHIVPPIGSCGTIG